MNARLNRENYFAWNGLALLLVGIALLLDRMGIMPLTHVLRFWPMLLVAAGTVILVESGALVSRTVGGVILGGGILLQARNLGYIQIRGDVFWPLALIAIGVVLLSRAIEERGRPPEERNAPLFPKNWGINARTWNTGGPEEAAVFGHVERRVTDQDFEKIKVVAVFGGFDLDLRQAGVKGDEAEVEAVAVFGGVQVVVPEDWQVIPRGTGAFGGFSDETRSPGPNATKRLIVKGAGVFGGVVISNDSHRDWRQWHREQRRKWRRGDASDPSQW
ncbi:MAG: hypothetical protein JO323_11995 [Acidobacteriia bacterium]|nr:hypothetical protein [Terriglobia bacterium]